MRQGGSAANLVIGRQPIIWDSSASNWISLSPAPQTDSGNVFGMWESQQVGALNGRASLWSGSAASHVDLSPPGLGTSSRALAIAGGQQVGDATLLGQEPRAALWRGSAASYVNLHPAGALRSFGNATDGLQQGGRADFVVPGIGTVQHAALWNGSAASFVDLNPGPGFFSAILAMSPGQQVGWVHGIGGQRAAMWSGTAQSWVNLHPSPAGDSMLFGTNGAAQVGFSHVPGSAFGHAGLWFGSASSFIDLQSFLPARFDSSAAYSVSLVGERLYIAGAAYDPVLGRSEAYLWVGPVPAPASGLVLLGLLVFRRRREP